MELGHFPMTVFLSLMGEQKVSRQFKQCHRTTSWAKSKLFSRLSSMFLRQLGKNIKFGQPPPNAIPMKKADRGQARLEEELFLTSPMETVTQDVILSDIENKPSDTPSPLSPPSLPGATREMEEKVAPVKPSRPKRHFSSAGTIESVNLDAIPLAIARLDNSAARHKLSVKPKNQRVSKKHRRLAGDQPRKQGGLPSQLSLDQNGHPAEDKAVCHEDEPELQDSEEEKRCQEEYWRDLEAKCRRQKAEAAERRRLEEQRLQALERRLWEESRRQELLEEEGEEEEAEEKELQLGAEVRQRGEERQRLKEHGCPGPEQREQEEGGRLGVEEALPGLEEGAEPLEVHSRQEAEKQWQEEEERELKELRRLGELEEQRWQEAERQRLEEERLEELEEQRPREEEEKRLRELQRQEELEEQRHQEEEEAKEEARQLEETEAQRRRGAEECREAPSLGQGSQRQLDDNPPQTDFAEKPEEQERLKPEKPGENSEEPSIFEESHEVEPSGEQQGEQGDVHRDDGCATVLPPQKPAAQGEATPAPAEQTAAAPAGTDRQGEELRWQEVDEWQAMPRPYTFQVSSGGKQILFPKVNLSPVTPMKHVGLVSAPQELKARKASPAPHALPSSQSIPHTAILVTRAQLCGPAVNLSQIKDTACKSLLGLSEEKKRAEGAGLENPSRAGSGKARPAAEAPGSVAALAEWASIRSRILRNTEGERRGERGLWRLGAQHALRGRCDSRGNPRKTPPVNAKFSITPAWQKFSDGGTETSKENAEAESMRQRGVLGPGHSTAAQPLAAGTRQHPKGAATLEPTDTAEGCKFAKDLPSFLVPSLADPPQKAVARAEPEATSDSETASVGRPDPVVPGGEENASPFGIKLRRTTYSLRFHGDQQPEQKRKKRPGGPADGPGGRAPAQVEQPAEGVARPRCPAPAPCEDAAPGARAAPALAPGHPTAGGRAPAPEPDKAASRMPWVRKPALAPKPAGRTPPASPVSWLSRPCPVELPVRPPGRPDPEPSRPCSEGQDGAAGPPSPPPSEPRRAQEEEEDERRPASPALLAGQPEKPSQSPVAGKKEKPVLQSRHSLDGSRPAGKVEAAQPLWITLALKKQKGFREQQATREERKQAREAKQAEKLSKENVSVSPQPGSGCASRDGSLHKPPAQPEEQQPETAVSRLERREQLRKANTLPTSVTVEISDSAPTTQLVKEVTKRFSTPDAAPVSTEPAWLALAKRKAKAWSDCPQIIK
ncbi:capping protein-inhibiting regulator of actin dynamics isoform X2 [Manis javanica]